MWQTAINMDTVINYKDNKRQAFVRGFLKGLAAPLMLYATSRFPSELNVSYQELPEPTREQKSDWVRVGDALRKAAADDLASHRG